MEREQGDGGGGDGWMDERCFRTLFCTVKAELGRGQPGQEEKEEGVSSAREKEHGRGGAKEKEHEGARTKSLVGVSRKRNKARGGARNKMYKARKGERWKTKCNASHIFFHTIKHCDRTVKEVHK